MAVFCALNSNPDKFKNFREFDFYKECGKDCTCSAFELMCLQRNDQPTINEGEVVASTENGYSFSLESHNFEYATEC